MRKLLRGALQCALLSMATAGCTHALAASHPAYGLGRAADPDLVLRENIDVSPDGSGLPDGRGDAVDGATTFATSCRSCHGAAIRLDPKRWPYATTLFDYIRRAMPPDRAQRLAPNDVYSVTAYELFMNAILTQHELLDKNSVPRVKMPGAGDFIEQP